MEGGYAERIGKGERCTYVEWAGAVAGEVERFKYLGSAIQKNGRHEEHVNYRIEFGEKRRAFRVIRGTRHWAKRYIL